MLIVWTPVCARTIRSMELLVDASGKQYDGPIPYIIIRALDGDDDQNKNLASSRRPR